MTKSKLQNKDVKIKLKEITQARLKELLSYNPETGEFIWIKRTSNRIKVGDVAGTESARGYLRINLDCRGYYAHRLVWLYLFGYLPVAEIDHKDGDGKNNSLDNIREATHAENFQNLTLRSTNKSGFMGVSWHKQREKWTANIWINNKRKYLGLFKKKENAYMAYLSAKKQLHAFQPVPVRV